MYESRHRKGYDVAKSSKDEDKLGRWDFAEEIYSIIKNTPQEWSVRVGVYGGWGEGKTTVLNFIKSIAEKDNHIVILLNTWEYQNSEQLWEDFALKTYKMLKKAKVPIRFYKKWWLNIRIWGRRFLRRIILPIQPLAKLNQYSEAGMSILSSFLKFNKTIMYHLPDYVKDKKVIVLIDDLDRANPSIIPQLFFGIQEILDVMGFAFVVAFDPDLIYDSLVINNYISGRQQNYLEKIIDFPKWLPEPNDETYKHFLKNEFGYTIDFIEFNSVEKVFVYLNKNPRQLKQFIRSLVGLKEELSRHEKSDINYVLLLLIIILKNNCPKFYDWILNANELWKWYETDNLFGSNNRGETEEKSEELLDSIVNSLNNSNEEKENIKNIVRNMAGVVRINLYQSIQFHNKLTKEKAIITGNEFEELINKFTKNQSRSVIEDEIKQLNNTKENYLKELYYRTVQYRGGSLEKASDTELESKRKSHLSDANLALKLLKVICLELGGYTGDKPFLNVNDFGEIDQQISRWIHFTMPEDYKKTREQEKVFLIELCEKMTIDLKLMLEYLKPWYPFGRGVNDRPAEKELIKILSQIIERKLSVELLPKFLEEGWVYSVFNREEHLAEHYVLLRTDSYFWSSNLKDKFFEFFKNDEHEDILTLNAINFISLIDLVFFDPLGNWSILNEKNSIIFDQEIMSHIWLVATKQSINPRMFKSLESFRNKINERTKFELEKPKWWDDMKKMVEERRREEQIF